VGDIIVKQSGSSDKRALVTMTDQLYGVDGPIRWIGVQGIYAMQTQQDLEKDGWMKAEEVPHE